MSGVDIVRRITGGKAVYHNNEVTYSLTATSSEKLFPNDIVGTYEVISRCLARGLSFLGIGAQLAKSDVLEKREMTSRCFSVPSGNELLVEGRKICGSAQMRAHGGFLQHGSLLMKFDDAETSVLILSKQARETVESLRRSVTAVNEVISIPVSAEALCQVLQKGFIEELGIRLVEEPLTPSEKALSNQLIKKYQSDAWNRRRKKE